VLISVVRKPSKNGATIGDVYVDGVRDCYSLEDEIREIPGRPVSEWKVPGKTAIPSGKRRLVLTKSQRFGKVLPEILLVEGFSGVRIHAGNTQADTDGCILVGEEVHGDTITRSKEALLELMAAISQALDGGESVFIEIENP
jgi:hypothetical protein